MASSSEQREMIERALAKHHDNPAVRLAAAELSIGLGLATEPPYSGSRPLSIDGRLKLYHGEVDPNASLTENEDRFFSFALTAASLLFEAMQEGVE